MSSALEEAFPVKHGASCNPCFCCGRDARHRTLDAIVDRFMAGEKPGSLAADFGYPVRLIHLVILEWDRGSVAPTILNLA